MARICPTPRRPLMSPLEYATRLENHPHRPVDRHGALLAANHLKVAVIAALTESGSTALWMLRLNAGVLICALTQMFTPASRSASSGACILSRCRRRATTGDSLLRGSGTATHRRRRGRIPRIRRAHHRAKTHRHAVGGTNTLKIVQRRRRADNRLIKPRRPPCYLVSMRQLLDHAAEKWLRPAGFQRQQPGPDARHRRKPPTRDRFAGDRPGLPPPAPVSMPARLPELT
ncbi:MAG: hypothetical protein IPJ52_13690 [Rhodocyclaceae bacterium]|nr:hypothetical protein [Rhodocyclaceae bacterium]